MFSIAWIYSFLFSFDCGVLFHWARSPTKKKHMLSKGLHSSSNVCEIWLWLDLVYQCFLELIFVVVSHCFFFFFCFLRFPNPVIRYFKSLTSWFYDIEYWILVLKISAHFNGFIQKQPNLFHQSDFECQFTDWFKMVYDILRPTVTRLKIWYEWNALLWSDSVLFHPERIVWAASMYDRLCILSIIPMVILVWCLLACLLIFVASTANVNCISIHSYSEYTHIFVYMFWLVFVTYSFKKYGLMQFFSLFFR